MVSMAAGLTSLVQSGLSEEHMKARIGIALLSIAVAVFMAPPQEFFDWVVVGIYFWVRIAEAQKETLMRTMFIVSPIIWALIFLHAGAYSVIFADVIAAYLAIKWVVDRMDKLPEQALKSNKGEVIYVEP